MDGSDSDSGSGRSVHRKDFTSSDFSKMRQYFSLLVGDREGLIGVTLPIVKKKWQADGGLNLPDFSPCKTGEQRCVRPFFDQSIV
ncbi:hypothetical protein FY136_19310 [Agrobacterium tumefaciens]|uniref:hypothetical protein n=1 Tax=Agrobacterium tumefaciens TaxID=358 RepID=UPI0021D2B334|nr:hypothetical protein [Agrobacterium tumefaciens]UXT51430.1 hypothetical protein FY136_19310 [Agrobacterium tumefaciens]